MMDRKGAKEIVDSGKGVFGDKYRDACEVLAHEHQNDPCPAELQKTRTLEVDGQKCKVYYNYVAPYGSGVTPMNCWWGVATGIKIEGSGTYGWRCPLNEKVKTLEQACEAIGPLFKKALERAKQRVRGVQA